jgi:hypothetical protein
MYQQLIAPSEPNDCEIYTYEVNLLGYDEENYSLGPGKRRIYDQRTINRVSKRLRSSSTTENTPILILQDVEKGTNLEQYRYEHIGSLIDDVGSAHTSSGRSPDDGRKATTSWLCHDVGFAHTSSGLRPDDQSKARIASGQSPDP